MLCIINLKYPDNPSGLLEGEGIAWKRMPVAWPCVLIMSSPFHLRCTYQVSVQTGRTHTRESQNSWSSRTWQVKHLQVVRGLALRISKYRGDDAQGWGGLGLRTCWGMLLRNGPFWVRTRGDTDPCPGSGPAQKPPNPDGRGESSSSGLFASMWQCFIVKKTVLARNVTTLFSIKKHFPLKNRHKLEASVTAPFQSVVTMASFSSPDASVEISTSACMVLIKAAK